MNKNIVRYQCKVASNKQWQIYIGFKNVLFFCLNSNTRRSAQNLQFHVLHRHRITSNNASVLHITSSNIRFVKDELRDFFKKRTSHKMHAVLFSFPLQNAKTFARSLNVLSVINPCRLYLERNVFLNTGDFCM